MPCHREVLEEAGWLSGRACGAVCYHELINTLELNWLGSPQVQVDGRPARLETRKVTAFLAVLSFDRRPQSREFLAALLWPEFDLRRAPANLRRALASLQASLGVGWVEADRETIALSGSQEIRIDLELLIGLVQQAQAHHAEPGEALCTACVDKLQEAVRLHRGDFFEGFNLKDSPGFDRWQMEKREDQCCRTGPVGMVPRIRERRVSEIGPWADSFHANGRNFFLGPALCAARSCGLDGPVQDCARSGQVLASLPDDLSASSGCHACSVPRLVDMNMECVVLRPPDSQNSHLLAE